MPFTMQGAGPILHWFTLVILLVMPVIGAIVLYKLGGLPGSIAASRGHPQATAINVCGWMGVVTLVLWPLALVWAHMAPRGTANAGSVGADDATTLLDDLRKATQRLVAIESKIAQRKADGGGSP
jgi:hypothetical protein